MCVCVRVSLAPPPPPGCARVGACTQSVPLTLFTAHSQQFSTLFFLLNIITKEKCFGHFFTIFSFISLLLSFYISLHFTIITKEKCFGHLFTTFLVYYYYYYHYFTFLTISILFCLHFFPGFAIFIKEKCMLWKFGRQVTNY